MPSAYPGNWDSIKIAIIKRDKHKCAVCGKKDHEPQRPPLYYFDETRTRTFRVHHRDGNKRNNNPENLVYLCAQCHGKAHRKMSAEAKSEVV